MFVKPIHDFGSNPFFNVFVGERSANLGLRAGAAHGRLFIFFKRRTAIFKLVNFLEAHFYFSALLNLALDKHDGAGAAHGRPPGSGGARPGGLQGYCLKDIVKGPQFEETKTQIFLNHNNSRRISKSFVDPRDAGQGGPSGRPGQVSKQISEVIF